MLLLIALVALTPRAWAQEAQVVDRIAAVVGNEAILASEIDEQLFILYPQGKGLPDDPAALQKIRRDILNDLIANQLLLYQARRDTLIRVTEEDVDKAVDELVRNTRGRYTSEPDFLRDLQVAGFQTIEEWRSWLRDQQRDALTLDQMKSMLEGRGKLKTVVPTEQEMHEFFESRRGQQQRPETITLQQIILAPQPTDAAKLAAFTKADSIAKELRAGADFATAARRFSMDPGSKEQGGSLNWFRRGVMHPDFERVAFGYKPGVISDPVETPFGYHVIQVQRVQAAEVQARHILIIPDLGPAEVDSARRLANDIVVRLRAGASFDSMQVRYHDDAETKDLERFPVSRLPQSYKDALANVPPNEFSGVFELAGPEGTRSKFAVVQVLKREPAGEIQFDDARPEVLRLLTDAMTMRRYIAELQRANNVDIRVP